MLNNPELMFYTPNYRENDISILTSYQKELISDILPDTADDVLNPLRFLAENLKKLCRLS